MTMRGVWETEDLSNTANEFRNMYQKLKKAGKIPTEVPMETKYDCPDCKDTGWIITEDGAVPCRCLAKRTVVKRLKRSGINPEEYARYRLDNFLEDTVEHKKMKELAIDFLRHHKASEGLAYTGKSGTGKTHICIATLQTITRQYGEPHYYFNYRGEIQAIKGVMYSHSGEYEQAIKKWTEEDNLYIDDVFKFAFDTEGNIQRQDLQIMFDIINRRYINHKTTIISSEVAIRDIVKADEALGSRLKSLIKYGMNCTGDNMRLKKGKR